VWARRIERDGSLSRAELIATGLGATENDVGAVLPLVYLPDTDCVAVLYRMASGELWERRTGANCASSAVRVTSQRVVQNAVDSDQVGADAIGMGNTVHVIFIDDATRDLYYARSDEPGKWTAATPVVTDINAQWVRGVRVVRADGTPVYGFVYDAGSDGGSGMNRYGEVRPEPARTPGS
jgi:hypothetical protein